MFFRSRSAKVGVIFGIFLALAGGAQVLNQLLVGRFQLSSAIGALWVVVGPLLARRAWSSGVTVSDEGISCRSGAWFVPNGMWTWHEIERVDVYRDEYRRDAPDEVALHTQAGEIVRLGRLPGRARLIEHVRTRREGL